MRKCINITIDANVTFLHAHTLLHTHPPAHTCVRHAPSGLPSSPTEPPPPPLSHPLPSTPAGSTPLASALRHAIASTSSDGKKNGNNKKQGSSDKRAATVRSRVKLSMKDRENGH